MQKHEREWMINDKSWFGFNFCAVTNCNHSYFEIIYKSIKFWNVRLQLWSYLVKFMKQEECWTKDGKIFLKSKRPNFIFEIFSQQFLLIPLILFLRRTCESSLKNNSGWWFQEKCEWMPTIEFRTDDQAVEFNH